ncbi:glucose-6-phosphate isomerase [Flagellatimonas centrodinii]|uniref:glucose-6-phosphate isomerase n=1 Tax=Flagellatimonas centrodinii TaxID=2806210 RepID=UPI001FEF222A|nr:glucose-6-phosphate isomerase [Flagellatimonas centrodinii]ULQ45738.1 glucose-6-phosphate isomerase [Flagellatimonas centrodinii]
MNSDIDRSSPAPSRSAAWAALTPLAGSLPRLNELFAADPGRAERMTVTGPGCALDFSKQRVTPEALESLLVLADACDLRTAIGRLFAGERVNLTEGRAALHMALRAPPEAGFSVDGEPVGDAVESVLQQMTRFADAVRQGRWRGHGGAPIKDVVNIGIGGSDLGPRMVCEALQDQADGPRTHFVANVDAGQLSRVLRALDPQSTLFIITSKTFTTQETMANARAARAWCLAALPEAAIADHFVAVSTNAEAVVEFGIAPDNMFAFWDWVGGRYSVWSAVGLPVMLALGPPQFRKLLAGARAMDRHFVETPFATNLPVLMGLLAVWNHNLLGAGSQVVAPYAQALERFVNWLQQLEMESNGKCVSLDGEAVSRPTTPALWGDVGSNSQHAFFQMLHQGTQVHPVDFILPMAVTHRYPDQHRMLVANCLAQSAALMRGRDADTVRRELTDQGLRGDALEAAIPHRVFPGDRPSSTLLLDRLDPWHLGALMALYEHRTYVLSVLWDVNAFDQWGVELGKQLTRTVLGALAGGEAGTLDPSTLALVRRFRAVVTESAR